MIKVKIKKISKKLLKFFLQGLLYITPISITIFAIYKVFTFFDELLPFRFPGIGIIVIVVSITLIGFIGTTIIAQPIVSYIGRLLEKLPLIKVIYTSIKDLLSAFVGQEKKFTEPVLIRMSQDSEIYKLGFITCKDLKSLGLDDSKVAVYCPQSYNFAGNLLIVPKKNITPIGGSSAEVMKFIISGGVTEL